MIETVVISALLGLGWARADEPIPFDQKLLRQTQFRTEHAWRPGERIRAPFFSHCERALTLTVAPEDPGGLRVFKHSDHFVLEDSDAHLEKIRDWRGKTYHGVLEVIAPVPDAADAENAQTYRARVVALETPTLRINPSRDEVKRLKKDEAVILLGQVVELGPNFVRIEAKKFTHKNIYYVNLRGGAPVLEDDLSDTIQTLTGRERLRSGDYVHLRAYFNGGALRAEARRSCQLEYPGPRRLIAYARERGIVRRLTASLTEHSRRGEFAAARMADAALQSRRLTPDERARLERRRAQIPAAERALVLAADERGDLEVVDRAFDVHLEEMTLDALRDFARRWATMKVAPARAEDAREQGVLLGLLRKVGASNEWMTDLAATAARHRLRYFGLRSEVGFQPKDSDWREMINLIESLRDLGQNPTPAGVDFVISTVVQLAHLENAGWSYAGRFLKPAFEVLNRQVNFAREERSATGAAMRDIFARRAVELRAALEDVEAGQDLDRPSSPALHILRFVLEIADAW